MSITDRGMNVKPEAKDIWLSESFGRGSGVFMGRITPNGERVFYFRYTDAKGARPFLPIGNFAAKGDRSGLTVGQARQIAAEWSAIYRAGARNLREHFEQERKDGEAAEAAERTRLEQERIAAEQAAQRRVTVRTLFEQWQRAELTPTVLADGTRIGRKDGGLWVLASFERRLFPRLGNTPAEEVRRADLLVILDECKAHGRRRTANVLLADMRQMFRFAAEREVVPKNPLDGINRATIGGKDVERDRVLSEAEIVALRNAVPSSGMSARSQTAVWLILATGCRISEAMGALWEHITLVRNDRDQVVSGRWYLPTTKNQRDHTIHLSEFAIRQIEVLKVLRDQDLKARHERGEPDAKPHPWVFPNAAGDGSVCIKSFGKQLSDRQRDPEKRLSNRAKNTTSLSLAGGKWTAHDLRRTAATVMAGLGISTDVIDECLNHKLQSKVARVYIKNRRLNEQARAFDALGNRLTELVEGVATGSNVVTMVRGAA